MKGPLKTHGGKRYLAERLVSLMPPHTHYVEPYAGGLAVRAKPEPPRAGRLRRLPLKGDAERSDASRMEWGLGAIPPPAYLFDASPEQPALPCGDCGAAPALTVRFRQTIGLLLAWKNKTYRPTLCRDCGVAFGNDVSRRSLVTGWWGIFAPIVNVLTLRGNAREIRRLRRLPATARVPSEYRK